MTQIFSRIPTNATTAAGESSPASPANVAVVSPMPHMTKSKSVSEAQGQGQGGKGEVGKEGAGQGTTEDPLRGELFDFLYFL